MISKLLSPLNFFSALAILLFSANDAFSKPRLNPITSFDRLWFEWNLIPNTQWSPRLIDSEARPDRRLQIFKIQPVISYQLNENFTFLTRSIFRFTSSPTATPVLGLSQYDLPNISHWDQKYKSGLSDISPTAFLVPNLGPDWTLGLGASMVIPAADLPTNSGKLSLGPAFLAYYHRGSWTIGTRMRNIWSVAGDPSRKDINNFIAQPLVRYQFNKKWYFTSSPIISANWTKTKDDGWTVPIGGGLGYVFRIAKQPMQISIEAYYNAIKPSLAGEELLGDWTIRTQLQVLFPRRAK